MQPKLILFSHKISLIPFLFVSFSTNVLPDNIKHFKTLDFLPFLYISVQENISVKILVIKSYLKFHSLFFHIFLMHFSLNTVAKDYFANDIIYNEFMDCIKFLNTNVISLLYKLHIFHVSLIRLAQVCNTLPFL